MNRSASAWILRSVFVLAVSAVLGILPFKLRWTPVRLQVQVTDPSGAVVNGAKVTLTNEGTGAACR